MCNYGTAELVTAKRKRGIQESDGHGGGFTDGVKGVMNEINKKKVQTGDFKDDLWDQKEKQGNSFENVS